jgi:hypothetical protein
MTPTFVAIFTLIVCVFRITETHPTAGLLGKRPEYLNTLFPAAPTSRGRGPPAGAGAGAGAGAPLAVPRAVYAVVASLACGSFAFTAMTSMFALASLYLFNFGTTQVCYVSPRK